MIYLIDNSILENIAFGIPYNEIDLDMVKKASEKALIDNFILSTYDGYKTKVGEQGVSLSGGQRQRIGIARALYKIYTTNTNLIVLDEATNALDSETERKIMDYIFNIPDITKIIISHNLNILSNCNRIIDVSKDLK